MVSLSRDSITSMIFEMVYATLLRGFALTRNSETTPKLVKRVAARRAGRPDLLLPHFRETLLIPVQHRLTCLRHELTSPQSIKCVSQVLWHHSSSVVSRNVYLLRQRPNGPARDPGRYPCSPCASDKLAKKTPYLLCYVELRVQAGGGGGSDANWKTAPSHR